MDSPIDLIVSEVGCEKPAIRRIRLRPADGLSLRGWVPGAHVNMQLPDGDQKSYSLSILSAAPTAGSIQLFMWDKRKQHG